MRSTHKAASVSGREMPAVNAGQCMGGMQQPIKQTGMSQWPWLIPTVVSREGETQANAPKLEADPSVA
jgi:hypothetical protein